MKQAQEAASETELSDRKGAYSVFKTQQEEIP